MTTISTKYLVAGIILLAFFSMYFVATAEEATTANSGTATTSTRSEIKAVTETNEVNQEILETSPGDDASTTKEPLRTGILSGEEREALRNIRQQALDESRQQRVLNLSANISNRMEAAIERLFNIIERFEGRISKLKAVDVNTVVAEEKLREAVQLLSKARATLNDIDSLVQKATSSTQPKTDWKNVRTTYLEAGRLIRESHQALQECVALLKTALAEADLQRSEAVENASTQASSTP